MATFYGSWVSSDDFRAILEATVSNTSATQCQVKLVLKVQSNYAYAGSSGRASVTCNGTTRSDSVSYDAGETTPLMTETFTVARGSSKKNIAVSGKVWQTTGGSAYAKGSTASGSVSIPAIDYDAPSAPSSCSASRVSDTQAKVTWKNGSTSTTKPRSSTKVERQTDGGSWVQVASVGSSATSYTDNGVSANHRYRYRVRAQGAGGYSTYATSGYIYTTPAAPKSVSAAVATGTTCTIDVDGSNAPYAESWEVQSSLNGGEWQSVGTYPTFPQTVDLGGGTVKIRARSIRGSLASAWAESATITTITPPLAPTVALEPSGVQPTGTAVTVAWTPVHPDGSAQTQAQVAYKVGSAAEQTATVSGAATSYQLPSSATASPATVSVRVRTHGADEDWGAWSEPVTLTVAEPPSVAITSPASDGAVVADLPLVAAWAVSDSTGVAAQLLEVVGDDGTTLHAARLDGAARSYELGASTYLLANLTDYTLRLTATGGSTLQATAERDFSVSFAEPSAPTVDAEVDESDMSVELTVYAGPTSTDAGGVVTVAEHAPAGTPVPGFTVYGNTRQNLWVNPSGTNSGITATSNADGSVTLSGTASAYAIVGVESYILKKGSTYTVIADNELPEGATFRIRAYNGDAWVKDIVSDIPSATAKTFIVPNDDTFDRVRFAIVAPNGTTVSGTYRIMLNEGSEARPWCPPGLNGVDELSVISGGANLLSADESGWKLLTEGLTTISIDGDDITVSNSSGTYQRAYIVMDELAGRAVDFGYESVEPNVYTAMQLKYNLDGVAKYVNASNAPMPHEVPDRATSIRLELYSNNSSVDRQATATYHKPYLRVDGVDAYSPLSGFAVTPIDLDGHALNSLPDGTRDELTVDATGAVTLLKRTWRQTVRGTNLAEDYAGNTNGCTIWGMVLEHDSVGPNGSSAWLTDGVALGDVLSPLNAAFMQAAHGFSGTSYSATTRKHLYVNPPSSSPTDYTGARAWLNANPLTIIYKLATPQIIDLPSVTLPSWPDGEANLWASAPVPTEMRVDYPDIDHITVQRVNSDGSLWVVGDGLADGETVVDPLPPLNVLVDYVVTAHTAAGATSEVRVTETLQALVGAFNFGSAAGVCELARLDPDWSHDVAHSGTLYHFADGGEGGGLPVAYGGQDVDATRSMGFTLLDLDQLRRLQDIARRYFTCWYRDPYGGRALCAVSWSFSSGIPYDKLSVSASMTETVFEEAW